MIIMTILNCSGKGNYAEKKYDFKIEKTLSSDEPGSPYFFARILDVCTNSKYIYISDWKNYCIKIYDHHFNFIKKVGKKGNGPGEFGQIFVHMTCNEQNLYLITVNRLYKLSELGDFKNETVLKFLPGQIFLIPGGFLFKRNSPGDVFAITDAKGDVTGTFYKKKYIVTKACGKRGVEPQAFVSSKGELLVMDSMEYKIESVNLSTKTSKMLITRDVDFLGLECTRNSEGETVFEGGYSWFIEGKDVLYYLYFDSKRQLKIDVFHNIGRNGLELKSTGTYTGNFQPLCILPGSKNRFIGINPDESHMIYICRLVEVQ